ncbi:peptide-N-glycosidase [Sphingobacterium sp. DK4209]|uniref:Peptide-N-glycosidase n=1 Tax=Sphingobacterium zhuxiongii TaxID=2662364 RepID=A0A5Q0QBI4_9SPHI|nr:MULTISPECIES: PNGase F N-terminal domain-containing protein [unclassified Sphingobacterium]MVZ67083.1 peptide-N-glycosidase [Sphingobacterium sp. DK4209]QGA26846.1 peptide-N-glycosidase [Sphingobacterium sp. dk4302]
MLNRFVLSIFLACFFGQLQAQETYKITYHAFRDGAMLKQDPIVMFVNKDKYLITKESVLSGQLRYPTEQIFVDIQEKKGYRTSQLSADRSISSLDPNIFKTLSFVQQDTGAKKLLKHPTKLARTSINSNAIDIWYTNDLGLHASPNLIGQELGLVLEYRRNGNSGIRVASIEKLKSWPKAFVQPEQSSLLDDLSYKDALWKSKFIQVPIFSNEQICFQPGIKSDSILRFAEGTVILKKVKIPAVSEDSQAFIELIEKSNGDAYDRTGSVFLIAEDQKQSFLDGMKNGMATLPMYTEEKGVQYPGMVRTEGFSPVLELMRFFTPFGVSHFNDRLQLKGKTWQDSVSYRQDISEFMQTIVGKDVYIGTYIGNYDKGGHKISLTLTIHPGASNYAQNAKVMPLFNTTNIMEMGGQGYPTMYAYEQGLEVKFKLDQDLKNVKLRYITTGHGGWGNGDEFVPKANSIYLDTELKMKFTPWRLDCGSYRLYNPVSGNFENGLSSSDLSRSNWCPGTITNPVFIDLGDLSAGEHTIRVHIPQGPKEGDSQSFWNTSGCLVYQ